MDAKVVQLFSCLDKISYIEWALDSEYILCGLHKRPMIQVWSLTQPEWTCKIDEGPAGIAYARWSPDSRHLLTTSEFQLRLTVSSLVNTACVHVQWPKHASKGVSFSKDGKFAAICTRRDCKDYINLLSCHNWEIMGVFAVDTLDMTDIEWSPDDSAIVIWDSPLVYKFLAMVSYDQMLRVLNHLTWKTFAEFMHLSTVRAPCFAAIFKEVDEPLQLDMSELCLDDDFLGGSVSELQPFCYLIQFMCPTSRCSRRTLQGLLSWSSDSQYICTRSDSMPTALWIWDIRHLELAAILVQKDPIRAAGWDPICTCLVLCTSSSHLYM
ncbi:ubiquinol-cytochrome c reductase complex chaperone CBP3-like protein [Hibiscus syriacus]|uniref:Ubiquinol-cytochrome c reductase complex chaperone CBP3-like protein n=1 Tax=Hibiscus syriacus TaxID=106335 RepID=A0A6A3AIR1_HIBSY|nr:ubiquinol-cytochrome c reductase complex chaperone CBP3-like protein [Hibiscus syriacus]